MANTPKSHLQELYELYYGFDIIFDYIHSWHSWEFWLADWLANSQENGNNCQMNTDEHFFKNVHKKTQKKHKEKII